MQMAILITQHTTSVSVWLAWNWRVCWWPGCQCNSCTTNVHYHGNVTQWFCTATPLPATCLQCSLIGRRGECTSLVLLECVCEASVIQTLYDKLFVMVRIPVGARVQCTLPTNPSNTLTVNLVAILWCAADLCSDHFTSRPLVASRHVHLYAPIIIITVCVCVHCLI